MANIALRFGSDLVAAIEHNRRCSRATSRILCREANALGVRLSCDQRWSKDEMQDDHVIFLQTQNIHQTNQRVYLFFDSALFMP
jgi:hypothetical protein